MPFLKYTKDIEKALQAGNATEHTYRPALKTLLEAIGKKITATNEPQRAKCGAPDYVISSDSTHGSLTIGYVEAKDVGKRLDEVEDSEQLTRYRTFLPNLILTDYLEFRWYIEGKPRGEARLARAGKAGKLMRIKGGEDAVKELLVGFLGHETAPISSPKELAQRLARLTHMIRDIIIEAIEGGNASDTLCDLRKAFAQTLIPDIDQPKKVADFADMYAQTIAYGLFAARCNHRGSRPFRRLGAAAEIPKTNPFLRRLFETITGADLDEEPYAGFVDDVATLLAHADINAVLEHFGKRTRRQDPVVHFYETFLAAYDPKLRESRGVYFTPEPVVSYIVSSVDHILKTSFGCEQGLSDTSVCEHRQESANGKQVKKTTPRVLILDPACGTGTFLYAVVDHIREQFMARSDAGMWSGYVKNHLLPRLFGFELLMAPYAVAHFKLGMQLAGQDLPSDALRKKWAYDFSGGKKDRLKVYMTNTLEGIERAIPDLFGWYRIISDEANEAREIKRDLPIMVVMGNPPYSGISANMGEWIDGLLKGKLPGAVSVPSYYEVDGKPLGEKKVWLQDDYVKFIRWGQWRIERTGAGILALITNHGYLDNPTFRGMRQQMMHAFTDIYIVDLHGNAKKKEKCPDGSKDENVFDIKLGVSIGIFVKEPGKKTPGKVHHCELWGTRERKYAALSETDITTSDWTEVTPTSPYYFFVPRDERWRTEYENGWKITDIMPLNTTGIVTARDHFAVDLDRETLLRRISDFRSRSISDDALRERYFEGKGSSKYQAGDTRGWKLQEARRRVRRDKKWKDRVAQSLYRPFDTRSMYYVPWMIDWPRPEVMRHMQEEENIGFHLCRQIVSKSWQHVLVTNCITDDCYVSNKTRERGYTLPLYLYPDPVKDGNLFTNGTDRHVNLNPDFLEEMGRRLRLSFVADGMGDLKKTFGPEDVFHYIYAVLHNPTYRERYAEFLRIDFPRVPLTGNKKMFRTLCSKGKKLVALHLLDSPKLSSTITRYPVPGDNLVAKGHPRYVAPGEPEAGTEKPLKKGRVYISKNDPKSGKIGQYFEGVPPEVWEFQIGGYQVCEKWLKDRRGRSLSYDDLTHYQKVVVALKETIRLMAEIDAAVPDWPIR